MTVQNTEMRVILDRFRDLSFFLHLRDSMWREKAAVMVGAGFSLNAIPLPGAKQMVTWGAFAARLASAIYAGNPIAREKAITDAMATGGMLRLGAVYECAFGRTALDNLIVELVPDNDYVPGDVHRDLVSLPWCDVLTTNYDTLLERACLLSSRPNYQTVCVEADIARANRPRVVKLHGSMPSTRPFVFTDEDFRTYPIERPAMVNLVQQVMLENTLCLIGFSGTDPNFLHWTGWARDRLGNATPNIYLVSLKPISQADRDHLRRRHTIPIDLSFLRELRSDDSIDDNEMILWFISSLANGKPINNLEWPRKPAPRDYLADPRLHCIPPDGELDKALSDLKDSL